MSTRGSIVVLRALKIGDLLVAVPALRAIRAYWPEHRVRLACSDRLAPIVELTGCVDDVIAVPGLVALPADAAAPDAAVNLHGTGPRSTEILDALRPRRRIGHRGHGWDGPEWDDDLHERDRWCALLTAHGIPADPSESALRRPAEPSPDPGAVLVHPGAAYGAKRWPADRFATVAAALTDLGHRVTVTGDESERPLADDIAQRAGAASLAGRTPLSVLLPLVAQARLVVSGDTGIAHLAYAFGTPSVTLFGPVPASRWGPPPGPHVTLSADAERRGEPFADDPDPALLGVSADDVLDATAAALAMT